jgi:homoserine dehydrogenase
VSDRPGVLAEVAGVFGRHGVSIQAMEQHGEAEQARLMFITHEAREADMQATIDELRRLEPVRAIGSLIRVLGDR